MSESAEALSIRQGGEASILSDLANSLSASLTDVMRWVYWWHTVIPDQSDVDEATVCVKLNTDFETAHLNGPGSVGVGLAGGGDQPGYAFA